MNEVVFHNWDEVVFHNWDVAFDPPLKANVLGNFYNEQKDIPMNAKIITANYDAGRTYDFFTDIEELKKGDYVVVRDSGGLSVVRVVGYKERSNAANAWVIDTISFDGEKKREKRAEIEKELKKAIEATSVLERAKQLAALNPELAALIAQLEELG